MSDWSVQQSRETYHIAHWSDGFFDISEHGTLRAYPHGVSDDTYIDLDELSKQIRHENITFPVLVRFPGILRRRIQSLHEAFSRAIQDHEYSGTYVSVYPIKVNQQRHVVESILQNGKVPVGLETGSKPELLATLALSSTPESVIICNGYKDREYIRLALIGQKIGHKVVIILEKLSELDIALEESEKLDLEPCLGVRIRLASISEGKWQDSGGEKSKFGFSASQILQVVEKLKEKKKLHLLRVLHFHLGSQVANIACIQRGMHEGARYYVALRELGVPIETIDVGGGLGVDYEGTKSRSACSMNYSLQEYANNIVYTISEICHENDLPHPNIVTESGRAMTAHHAMLITNIIATESACDVTHIEEPDPESPAIILELWNSCVYLSENNALEVYHDICHWMSEIHTMYIHGMIDIKQRAFSERVYYKTSYKLINFTFH